MSVEYDYCRDRALEFIRSDWTRDTDGRAMLAMRRKRAPGPTIEELMSRKMLHPFDFFLARNLKDWAGLLSINPFGISILLETIACRRLYRWDVSDSAWCEVTYHWYYRPLWPTVHGYFPTYLFHKYRFSLGRMLAIEKALKAGSLPSFSILVKKEIFLFLERIPRRDKIEDMLRNTGWTVTPVDENYSQALL